MSNLASSILGVAQKTEDTSSKITNIMTSGNAAGITTKKAPRPPKGMKREVFNLLQSQGSDGSDFTPSLPPITPSTTISRSTTPTVMNKDGTTSSPIPNSTQKWSWSPFTSSARTDGAVFYHWVKSGIEYPDYPFSRFNVHLDPLEYSDEEYQKFLVDPDWTRNDTDQLLSLCRTFSLRWPIIHDRFRPDPPRSLEQLMHRFYSVASRLTHVRVTLAKGIIEPGLPFRNIGTGTSSLSFNLAYEEERRRQLEIVWRRSKEEEQEHVDLTAELKAVDAQLRKLKKAGKAKATSGTETMGITANTSPVDTANNLFYRPLPQAGTPYLQSSRLQDPAGVNGLSKTLIKKMNLVLGELGIVDPIPSKIVVDMFDKLRKDIVVLLSLQKIASKKEQQVWQEKKLMNYNAQNAAAGQKRKADSSLEGNSSSRRRT